MTNLVSFDINGCLNIMFECKFRTIELKDSDPFFRLIKFYNKLTLNLRLIKKFNAILRGSFN